ncbi:MAG: ATP-binding cassette domain-containing protein, partial [bacterium]
MASVSIKNVWKYYGETAAVKDLNLEVQNGEFLCVLGPSGCGKSSSLRMLAGLEHISAGDIHFGDRRVNDLPPKDRDIAMVFENYALYPHKPVFANIGNALKLRKV